MNEGAAVATCCTRSTPEGNEEKLPIAGNNPHTNTVTTTNTRLIPLLMAWSSRSGRDARFFTPGLAYDGERADFGSSLPPYLFGFVLFLLFLLSTLPSL